ncbi:flagellar export chaperone FliS [Limnohabitans sp. DM1]|uniref:flagellar export chaperone FliS n=1 Tax=Limnohabitans sp. DM1 TaxID=1597955 RepID=UPI000ABD1D80|nr:flagellar export chaperone FliS [Limnohabitans sp. DM1]
MYLSVHAKAANAYRNMGAVTQVDGASPGQLMMLLFQNLHIQLLRAHKALSDNNIAVKGLALGKAVRILDEGLKAALIKNSEDGFAQSLSDLYGYCAKRLTQANFYNDPLPIEEVLRLMDPIADAWKKVVAEQAQSLRPMEVE